MFHLMSLISGGLWSVMCVSFVVGILKNHKVSKETFELQYYRYLLAGTTGMLAAIFLAQGLLK